MIYGFDISSFIEPIQLPMKCESVFVLSSDRFLCESDGSSEKYETFQVMTEKVIRCCDSPGFFETFQKISASSFKCL